MGIQSRFDPEVSVVIERAAARAWPAEEVEVVEGWLLRRTIGVGRKRSNSMFPPSEAGVAVRTLDMALAAVEELDFPAVVQVSPAEMHLALDEALADQGMTYGGSTVVLAGPAQARSSAVPVALAPLTPEWVRAWEEVTGDDGAEAAADLVLSQLGDAARFALVEEDGEPMAAGIGVVDGAWLGVFSLAVAPHARRRGLGTAVMDALESWGAKRGVRQAYLQVEADNEPALALYAQRGMTLAHSYHYRSAAHW